MLRSVLRSIHKLQSEHIFIKERVPLARYISTYDICFQKHSSSAKTTDDDYLAREIKNYEMGKRWLAKMMGVDVNSFTQDDINEAIQYLLPSHLFAKDARPMLKHPSEIFPKPKELRFDSTGRPLSSAYFTASPRYYDLTYEIWQMMEMLNSPQSSVSYDRLYNITSPSATDEPAEQQRMQWMHRFQLEDKLQEKVSEKKYSTVLFRLKMLADHQRTHEIQDFLRQFQVPVYTPGKEDLKDVEVFDGAARSMGYRKSAIAEVIVKDGVGNITVNDRPILEFFNLRNDREQIMFPLSVIGVYNRFDVQCHVIGGGHSGKSGAIRLGISRAIAALCPEYFHVLNEAKLLTRDLRTHERKKPGRKGARRAFQWVKR